MLPAHLRDRDLNSLRPAAETNADDATDQPARQAARSDTAPPTGAPSPGAHPPGRPPPPRQRHPGPREPRPDAARQPTIQPVPIPASPVPTLHGNVAPGGRNGPLSHICWRKNVARQSPEDTTFAPGDMFLAYVFASGSLTSLACVHNQTCNGPSATRGSRGGAGCRTAAPLRREPGPRITGACPPDVPELPPAANDRHQQQPANMKPARPSSPRPAHKNTLVMRRSESGSRLWRHALREHPSAAIIRL